MFKRILLFGLLIVGAVAAYEWFIWPDIARLADEPPRTTAFMDERRHELRSEGKNDTIEYTWVPYGRISPYLRRGVLVAEDNDFYEHSGVDVKAMEDAIRRDWAKKRMTQGGSTITQQLAKNLYLSSSRNPLRKIKEYFLARSLEDHLTKKRILELYLNVVEMGERVYGAEAASRYYFNEPASALTPSQAALVAGCLPNPRSMDPAHPNARLRWRQNMILSRLRRWGYLYEREVLTAPKPEAAPPASATEPQTQTTAPTPTTTPTDTDLTPPADTTATSVPTPPQSTTGTTTTQTAPTETLPPVDTTGTH